MDPTIRRLTRELRSCSIEGVTLELDESNLQEVTAFILGPEGTPYAGGRFRIRCCFGDDWPTAPPRCSFETKIFHPNVSTKGEICVNTLKKDWLPTHTVSHVLTTIKCLLIYPNPESALNEEAGRLLLEQVQYQDFARAASLMTSVHARAPENEHRGPRSLSASKPIAVTPLQPSLACVNGPNMGYSIEGPLNNVRLQDSSSSSGRGARQGVLPTRTANAAKRKALKRL